MGITTRRDGTSEHTSSYASVKTGYAKISSNGDSALCGHKACERYARQSEHLLGIAP